MPGGITGCPSLQAEIWQALQAREIQKKERKKMGKWMREYLLDAGRWSELINQVYKSPEIQETIGENGGQYDPVNPDWIDLKGSAEMTMAMQNMLPKEFPFLPFVAVIKDPEWTLIVEEELRENHKLRYILMMVIPDVPMIYMINYDFFHTSAVVSLSAWEMAHVSECACTALSKIQTVREPAVPYLAKAEIEHFALYLGRTPFCWQNRSCEFYDDAGTGEAEYLTGHVVEVRQLEATTVVQGLLSAYDSDAAAKEPDM